MPETPSTDIAGKPAAIKAVIHILRRMQDDPRLAYLLGLGSESFTLLTAAYAEHTGNAVETVRTELWDQMQTQRVPAIGANCDDEDA